MSKLPFIIYIIFWVCGRIYFLAPTYPESKVYHSIGLHIDIISLLILGLYYIPYSYIKLKVFIGYFLMYEIVGAFFFIYIQFNCDHVLRELMWETDKLAGSATVNPVLPFLEHLFIPLFVFFVSYQIYRSLERFDSSKSAKLNDIHIFYVLTYPKNWVGLFLCLFTGYKASSIALFYDGQLFCFKQTEEYLQVIPTTFHELYHGDYFLINTRVPGKPLTKELNNLQNIQWKIHRNCLNSFNGVVCPLKHYLKRLK